jgi:hypothetical protein
LCRGDRDLHIRIKEQIYFVTNMEVLKLTTTLDESGQLNLNLPTGLTAGEVNVVVVLNPVLPDGKPKKRYDFSKIAGRLDWEGDALKMQRELRDEW